MSRDGSRPIPTYYDILGLLQEQSRISNETVRVAYRKALLQHHPDKGSAKKFTRNEQSPLYSIDEIVAAYQTLSDPTARAEYEKQLLLSSKAQYKNHAAEKLGSGAHDGVEDVDLDEMTYEEKIGLWSKGCRCGNEKGYILDEEELNKAADAGEGEVYVGCEGCSLCIRVLFHVDEEKEDP
ncbi:MAG: hypothetical protein Q9227_000745 [Pyrenula ochraceoflavens]